MTKKPDGELSAAAGASSSRFDGEAALGSPIVKKRGTGARQPVAKDGPEQEARDPDAVTKDHPGRNPEGWYDAVCKLPKRVAEGMPVQLAALAAVFHVLDGLVHRNKFLPGSEDMQLPRGARFVGPPNPAPTEDGSDPLAGRDMNGLVPIPLWAAKQLWEVWGKANLAVEEARKSGERLDANKIDLNKLFGAGASNGSGSLSYFRLIMKPISDRMIATAVWEMVDRRTPKVSVDEAILAVANREGFGEVGVERVRKAWQGHKAEVRKKMNNQKNVGR